MRPFALALALTFLVACGHRHAATGLIVAVEPGRLLISHREIPRVMPAMTMPVKAVTTGLRPGDQIDFTLHVKKSAASNIRKRAGNTEGLKLEVPKETVPLEEPFPDFTLTDQQGRPQSLAELRGQTVAVNFIYTRCPLPDVCPRLTSHFARLQRRFDGRPVHFLTITLDPQYDTVAVLNDYARKWRADAAKWQLLTGSKEQTEGVARQFGMLYWPEQGQLVHTSVTGVIDPQGRLVAKIEGSSFEATQLGDLIEQCVTSSHSLSR